MGAIKNLIDTDLEGTGKPCPKCNAPMVSIHGTRGSRICSSYGKCGHSEKWELDEGQEYLFGGGGKKMVE